MSDSTALVHRGIDLSDAEDYEGVLKVLTRAIVADPGNPQAHFERGMVLLNLDRDAEAIADFDRALAIDPAFPGARDWRANTLESLGKHQSAAEDRLTELRAHPEGKYTSMGVSPQSWADCARAFANAGQHAKARELLEEFFREHEVKVTSYAVHETAPMRMMARMLMQAGEVERAREFAQRAYDSDHSCPMDIHVFALALERVGDTDHARRICGEAMAINDQMPGARELSDRLSEAV